MNDVFNQVKASVDIVEYISRYATLKDEGNGRFRSLCPLHVDRNNPSFVVNEMKKTYYCYSCLAKGSVIDFCAAVNNVSIPEALDMLIAEFGIKRVGVSNTDSITNTLTKKTQSFDKYDKMCWDQFDFIVPGIKECWNYLKSMAPKVLDISSDQTRDYLYGRTDLEYLELCLDEGIYDVRTKRSYDYLRGLHRNVVEFKQKLLAMRRNYAVD